MGEHQRHQVNLEEEWNSIVMRVPGFGSSGKPAASHDLSTLQKDSIEVLTTLYSFAHGDLWETLRFKSTWEVNSYLSSRRSGNLSFGAFRKQCEKHKGSSQKALRSYKDQRHEETYDSLAIGMT